MLDDLDDMGPVPVALMQLDYKEIIRVGGRICCDCGFARASTEFYRGNKTKKGVQRLASYCKPCACKRVMLSGDPVKKRAVSKAWREKNPDQRRGNHRNHIYGVTPEFVAGMLAAQGGRCAMPSCRGLIYDGGKDRVHMACVDHDHETGKIRGMLCSPCNVRLGFFEQNRKREREFLEYLAK